MKKAFLVDIYVRTRIISDIPEEEPNEKTMDEIAQKAIEKILKSPSEYIITDNVMEIEDDLECPYGTFKEDNLDGWYTGLDFHTMEIIFGLRHTTFSKADNYREFTEECNRLWKQMSDEEKIKIYQDFN